MHRLIVTSATYRQSSRATPDQMARDPTNRAPGRGPRFRVTAEVVRDIALSAAGLLSDKLGGPSAYPPQPEGATALAYSQSPWPVSRGADRYRRGLYTFLKRTAPYAASITMDAPTSEATCVRRERSNTPLQALTLLNDAVFVEAAQALARRVVDRVPRPLGRRPRPPGLPALPDPFPPARGARPDRGVLSRSARPVPLGRARRGPGRRPRREESADPPALPDASGRSGRRRTGRLDDRRARAAEPG